MAMGFGDLPQTPPNIDDVVAIITLYPAGTPSPAPAATVDGNPFGRDSVLQNVRTARLLALGGTLTQEDLDLANETDPLSLLSIFAPVAARRGPTGSYLGKPGSEDRRKMYERRYGDLLPPSAVGTPSLSRTGSAVDIQRVLENVVEEENKLEDNVQFARRELSDVSRVLFPGRTAEESNELELTQDEINTLPSSVIRPLALFDEAEVQDFEELDGAREKVIYMRLQAALSGWVQASDSATQAGIRDASKKRVRQIIERRQRGGTSFEPDDGGEGSSRERSSTPVTPPMEEGPFDPTGGVFGRKNPVAYEEMVVDQEISLIQVKAKEAIGGLKRDLRFDVSQLETAIWDLVTIPASNLPARALVPLYRLIVSMAGFALPSQTRLVQDAIAGMNFARVDWAKREEMLYKSFPSRASAVSIIDGVEHWPSLIDLAAKHGHTLLVEWLSGETGVLDELLPTRAVRGDVKGIKDITLDVVRRWSLRQLSPPADDFTLLCAASSGDSSTYRAVLRRINSSFGYDTLFAARDLVAVAAIRSSNTLDIQNMVNYIAQPSSLSRFILEACATDLAPVGLAALDILKESDFSTISPEAAVFALRACAVFGRLHFNEIADQLLRMDYAPEFNAGNVRQIDLFPLATFSLAASTGSGAAIDGMVKGHLAARRMRRNALLSKGDKTLGEFTLFATLLDAAAIAASVGNSDTLTALMRALGSIDRSNVSLAYRVIIMTGVSDDPESFRATQGSVYMQNLTREISVRAVLHRIMLSLGANKVADEMLLIWGLQGYDLEAAAGSKASKETEWRPYVEEARASQATLATRASRDAVIFAQDFPFRTETEELRSLVVPSLMGFKSSEMVWVVPYLTETQVRETSMDMADVMKRGDGKTVFPPQAGSILIAPDIFAQATTFGEENFSPVAQIAESLLEAWDDNSGSQGLTHDNALLPARFSAILGNYDLLPTPRAYKVFVASLALLLARTQTNVILESPNAIFIEILLSPRTTPEVGLAVAKKLALSEEVEGFAGTRNMLTQLVNMFLRGTQALEWEILFLQIDLSRETSAFVTLFDAMIGSQRPEAYAIVETFLSSVYTRVSTSGDVPRSYDALEQLMNRWSIALQRTRAAEMRGIWEDLEVLVASIRAREDEGMSGRGRRRSQRNR